MLHDSAERPTANLSACRIGGAAYQSHPYWECGRAVPTHANAQRVVPGTNSRHRTQTGGDDFLKVRSHSAEAERCYEVVLPRGLRFQASLIAPAVHSPEADPVLCLRSRTSVHNKSTSIQALALLDASVAKSHFTFQQAKRNIFHIGIRSFSLHHGTVSSNLQESCYQGCRRQR